MSADLKNCQKDVASGRFEWEKHILNDGGLALHIWRSFDSLFFSVF